MRFVRACRIATSCVAAALLCAQAGAQSARGQAETIVNHDATSLARGGAVTFQRGVFRVGDDGVRITALCIPFKGSWKQVGTMRDCGNPPPPEMQREISRFTPDVTNLGIRNLGISTEQWIAFSRNQLPGQADSVRLIAQAFSYAVTATHTRWRLETAKLPALLKADIPGSGIHVHFGGGFSRVRKPALFTAGRDFEVETQIAVPTYQRTGRAHSGLTVAVDLEFPAVGASGFTLPLIVSLLHPDPRKREGIGSDGRNSFVGTYLGRGTKYVHATENEQRTSSWAHVERFAFRITRENIGWIVRDLQNTGATPAGREVDESRLDEIKVGAVTLRNESRFLESGDVTIEVIVDYLRVNRVPITQ